MYLETQNTVQRTKGLVLHGTAHYYDLMVWLFMRGKEVAFRERVVDLAQIKTGESVLDVGCGTGTLAITAAKHVGPTGTVYGLDASPEMLTKAVRKAKKTGAEVVFKEGVVEALPFPKEHFDAVLSTFMLHHLPPSAREQCARELRRVLKPGGRVLAVDFATSGNKNGLLARLNHHRHGSVKLEDIIALFSKARLSVIDSGGMGMKDVNFVLATNQQSD